MSKEKSVELFEVMWESCTETYNALLNVNKNFEKAATDLFKKQQEYWNNLNGSVKDFNSELANTFNTINTRVLANIKEYGGEEIANQIESIQNQTNELTNKLQNSTTDMNTNEFISNFQAQCEEAYTQFSTQQADIQKQLQKQFEDVLLQWKSAQFKYLEVLEKSYQDVINKK